MPGSRIYFAESVGFANGVKYSASFIPSNLGDGRKWVTAGEGLYSWILRLLFWTFPLRSLLDVGMSSVQLDGECGGKGRT